MMSRQHRLAISRGIRRRKRKLQSNGSTTKSNGHSNESETVLVMDENNGLRRYRLTSVSVYVPQ